MSDPDGGQLAEQLQAMAREHVELANAVLKINLNYSESSLGEIDESISELQGDSGIEDAVILGYGSYVGETVRQNLGGVWETDERGVAFLKGVGGTSETAFPFSWVNQRVNGDVSESIANRYAQVKEKIASQAPASPIPETVPVAQPVVAEPVAIPETEPIAPAAKETAPTEPEPVKPVGPTNSPPGTKPKSSETKPRKKIRKVMISNADRDILWRSPALAFFLVAAADGNVDSKEIAGFEAMIAKPSIFPSPLFRKVIKDMGPQVGTYFEEMMQEDFDYHGALEATANLVDTKYSWEAETYKLSLLSLAKRVAQASGGFLGVGSKISKEEKAALVDISGVLRIKGHMDDLEGEDEEGEATPLGADDEVIARAPVLAFFLVAAADGNVDDKELADFEKMIGASSVFPSELFQKAIRDMRPRLQDYLSEMATEEVDHEAELKRLNDTLDEQYRAEAKSFKLSLFGLATKIAEASGGFLGVGNKISKEEEEALKTIALALGLKKDDEEEDQ